MGLVEQCVQIASLDVRWTQVCRILRSNAKLAVLLVSTLPLWACCNDCARLSQLGAATYSGPASTSNRVSQTPNRGASAADSSTQEQSTGRGVLSESSAPPPGAEAVGSGFYVNPKGQLLTTWEEVRGCRKMAILVNFEFRDATVVAGNQLSGLAVLRAAASNSAHAVFRTAAVAEGEAISAFAHPILDGISLPLDVASGIVRSSTSPDGISGILQDSAVLDGGGVGGPVVDENGDVVGIVVPRLSKAWPSDIGYGISNSAIMKFSGAAGVEIWERASDEPGVSSAENDGPPKASEYTVPVICFR